jgi:hypothetical protein
MQLVVALVLVPSVMLLIGAILASEVTTAAWTSFTSAGEEAARTLPGSTTQVACRRLGCVGATGPQRCTRARLNPP